MGAWPNTGTSYKMRLLKRNLAVDFLCSATDSPLDRGRTHSHWLRLPRSHGLAAKPSDRESRSERTAGTIPRLDGNTACTTPDRELNDGSSRTSAPLDKSSLASTTGRRATPTPRSAARCTV